MKTKTNNIKMISFRLPSKHIDMLNELAAVTGRPKSEHLRNGIEAMHRVATGAEHTRSKESF